MESEARPRIFAFGSNMCAGRMRRRAPSALVVGLATLRGHVLRFNKKSDDGSAKANVVVASAADLVEGIVYEVAAAELPGVDKAEGGYQRTELSVSLGAEERLVWVYVAKPLRVDDRLLPFAWYKALVVRGARTHGLTKSYVASVEAHAEIEDPDAERDGRERAHDC